LVANPGMAVEARGVAAEERPSILCLSFRLDKVRRAVLMERPQLALLSGRRQIRKEVKQEAGRPQRSAGVTRQKKVTER